MCLENIKSKRWAKSRAKLRKAKEGVFYKVYLVTGKRELVPYCRTRSGAVRPGVIRSDRKRRQLANGERKWGDVGRGIHVFLTRKGAAYGQSYNRRRVVVPVRAKQKDLVAFGSFCGFGSAVFMKVELATSDYQKALETVKP